MSWAPYISPEASPAEIRIRKGALYGYSLLEGLPGPELLENQSSPLAVTSGCWSPFEPFAGEGTRATLIS